MIDSSAMRVELDITE